MFRVRLIGKLPLALFVTAGFGCLIAAAASPPPPAPAAVATTAAADETAARNTILASPAWQQAMYGFNQWLSVQIIYPKDQVPQIKAQMTGKVNKMSASQLRAFLEDLQQKLVLLGSKEAIDDRGWAEQYLNLLATPLAEKFRKSFPDVANMTAAQVQQALYDIRLRREGHAAYEKSFQEQRDQENAAITEMNRQSAEAQAQTQAAMDAQAGSQSGGGYAPINVPAFNPFAAPLAGGWRW